MSDGPNQEQNPLWERRLFHEAHEAETRKGLVGRVFPVKCPRPIPPGTSPSQEAPFQSVQQVYRLWLASVQHASVSQLTLVVSAIVRTQMSFLRLF